MPKLYAIADLHLSYKFNRDALSGLAPHPEDSLILAGDVGEKVDDLRLAFSITTNNFKNVFWVPGNHELYTLPSDPEGLKGVAKYEQCLAIAKEFKVRTSEDPWFMWTGDGGPCIIALCFLLYDYSFRPGSVSREGALDWAKEHDIVATDEALLFPEPYATRDEWCNARVRTTEERLEKAAGSGLKVVIVNHWPFREDLITIPRIPRFSLWCGTKRTEDWHVKYNASVVVTGHLHVRRTDWRDGVRFEECSLGYPRQWEDARKVGRDINTMLREVLPGPEQEGSGTIWRRWG